MAHGLPGEPGADPQATPSLANERSARKELERRCRHLVPLIEALDRLYVHTMILRSELQPESRELKIALDNAKAVREQARAALDADGRPHGTPSL